MVSILNYFDFINETKMTSEKDGAHLELNDRGKKLPPFSYYYEPEMDDNNYFVIKSIPYEEYRPTYNRVTLLDKSLYFDTDVPNRKGEKLDFVDFDDDKYYFYKMVSTPRSRREIHGVPVRYLKSPQRFGDQLTKDGRKHYIVIPKAHNRENVTSVRLNSSERGGAGDKAEKIIRDKFGWKLEQTKISKNIIQNKYDDNGIVPGHKKKAVLFDILKADIEVFRKYKDLFDFADTETISKHDLVITNGKHAGEKIEVKKYSSKDLFYANGAPKEVMVSEQLKISDYAGVKRVVDLYQTMNPNDDVSPLLLNYSKDGGLELNDYFKKEGGGRYRDLVSRIRKFFNDKIYIMKEKYDNIPQDQIMTNVFGVYFFSHDNGVDGFLIKNENNNFQYLWRLSDSHWGLERVNLKVKVNPQAKRMVWLGDLNIFVETFEVGNLKVIPSKENSIIRGTDVGAIKWDGKKGYWVVTSDKEVGNLGISLEEITTKKKR